MDNKKVRIGNTFIEKFSKTIIKVVGINEDSVIFEGDFNGEWQAEPIPLKIEHFNSLGYELLPWGFVKDSMPLICYSVSKKTTKAWVNLGNGYRINLNYLHELENLEQLNITE